MSVEIKFDAYAMQYDYTRKQLIPCFDDFYQTVISIIQSHKIEPSRILDLGAGTGLLSRLLAPHFTNASFHLVDVAEQMLNVAATHPIFENRDIKYTKLNLNDLDQIPDEYDLVVSSLAIHHLNAQEKEVLFRQISRKLNKGGLFINADQALGETVELEKIYRQNWLEAVRPKVSDNILNAALDRMKEDQMDTLSHQLAWLQKAGFTDVNCWYQNYSFCVYSGQKT